MLQNRIRESPKAPSFLSREFWVGREEAKTGYCAHAALLSQALTALLQELVLLPNAAAQDPDLLVSGAVVTGVTVAVAVGADLLGEARELVYERKPGPR